MLEVGWFLDQQRDQLIKLYSCVKHSRRVLDQPVCICVKKVEMCLFGFKGTNLPLFKIKSVAVAAIPSFKLKLSYFDLQLNIANGVVK